MKAQIVNDLISKGLLEMGAKAAPEKDFGYPGHYTLLTRYGLLTVSVHEPAPMRGNRAVFSCFSCFAEFRENNPYITNYCYKHNWHQFAKDFTPESFAELVLSDIRKLLDFTDKP